MNYSIRRVFCDEQVAASFVETTESDSDENARVGRILRNEKKKENSC